MLYRAQVDVWTEINTKHINRAWAECTVFLARSQNCEKQLLASSRPHGTRLPLRRFSYNLIPEYFFRKSVEKIQVSLKSDNNNGYFTEDRYTVLRYLVQFCL